MFRCLSFPLLVILLYSSAVRAQDKFCQIWYTEGKTSKIQIYLGADGKYYGKIVWLRDGIENGQPLLDKKNPDPTKRNNPYLGLEIITGLIKKSETELVNGKIYDPVHGKYYSCKMTLNGSSVLELRGYVLGIPFLGKTTTWYLVPPAGHSPKSKLSGTKGSPEYLEKNP